LQTPLRFGATKEPVHGSALYDGYLYASNAARAETMDGFHRILWVVRQHSADHSVIAQYEILAKGRASGSLPLSHNPFRHLSQTIRHHKSQGHQLRLTA